MRLYIDKANLISFLDSRRDVEYMDIYADCERMVRRQLSVQYNFPKDQCNDEGKLQAWFLNATNGCGYKESPDVFANTQASIFPPRPIKGTFYNQISAEQISSVFLVSEQVNAIKQSHTILIGGLGEEISTLRRLFCKNDYDFSCKYLLLKDKFKHWEQLDHDGHILPTMDILIADRYIFGGEKDIDESILEQNLYSILKLFGTKKGAKINLVIFSIGKRDSTLWEARLKKIKGCLYHNKGSVNVTLVFYAKDRNGKYSHIPHDRFIITNYRLFTSLDSFSYFNSINETISNGTYLQVDSLVKDENRQVVSSMLEWLQQIYNDVKKLNNDMLIIGNKESNLLQM